MLKCSKKMVIYTILAIFFVILDRFLKNLALIYLADSKIDLVLDIFSLTLAKNYHIAFSLPLSGPILTIFIGILIILLIFYWLILIKKQGYSEASALTFVLFGAISNILDRIKYGFVVDYFDLKYFTVFNLADTMIVCGVIALICRNFFKTKNP